MNPEAKKYATELRGIDPTLSIELPKPQERSSAAVAVSAAIIADACARALAKCPSTRNPFLLEDILYTAFGCDSNEASAEFLNDIIRCYNES